MVARCVCMRTHNKASFSRNQSACPMSPICERGLERAFQRLLCGVHLGSEDELQQIDCHVARRRRRAYRAETEWVTRPFGYLHGSRRLLRLLGFGRGREEGVAVRRGGGRRRRRMKTGPDASSDGPSRRPLAGGIHACVTTTSSSNKKVGGGARYASRSTSRRVKDILVARPTLAFSRSFSSLLRGALHFCGSPLPARACVRTVFILGAPHKLQPKREKESVS